MSERIKVEKKIGRSIEEIEKEKRIGREIRTIARKKKKNIKAISDIE